jgi:arylsulfatase A-like enzyme
MPYWPKDDAEFLKVYHVRGVLHSYALPDGKQRIEDTGPLDMKRMETIDDETSNAAMTFIDKQAKGGKPFFVWMNFTRMHIFTHIRPEYHEKSGMPGNDYADGMWEHDQDVGKLLKQLDDLGITKDTIVVYTTDNGPNMFSWPDAAMTPFRSEKDSNWEGAFRVPAVVRWPGRIKADVWSNEIVSGLDWFPTLLAAAGDPNVKEQLLKGWAPVPGGHQFKVHLDGYNILPYLEGQEAHSPRRNFFYFDDDGQLVAMRHDNWKFVYCEQRAPGNLNIWMNPFTCLRLPKIYNLRMDPYERADITSDQYNDWLVHNVYLNVQGVMLSEEFMDTFKEYPASQAPASFTVDPEAILKMLKYQQSQMHKD